MVINASLFNAPEQNNVRDPLSSEKGILESKEIAHDNEYTRLGFIESVHEQHNVF